MNDFNTEEIEKLSAELHGQVIDRIRLDSDRMDELLEISLSDGRVLRFRYDYIYEFEIKSAKDAAVESLLKKMRELIEKDDAAGVAALKSQIDAVLCTASK